MKLSIALMAMAIFASVAGGVFILKQEKEIVIENNGSPTPIIAATSTILGGSISETLNQEVEPQNISTSTEDVIKQVQALILETQKFIEKENEKKILVEEAREKSSKIRGIYAGTARNQGYFKNFLSETDLNGVVIDIKESYGINLPISLRSFISELHKESNWVIARIVLFRDSSLIEEKPEWYLFATSSPWRDGSSQYWFDPSNKEVQDYLIEFSKKAIDYGFDELQFDYIRYPDDYTYIPGEEKVKIMGEFFSDISKALKEYKPSIILSADLFGYVATQFNSYGTGQRLFDAGKYFDYLSFMLYPSHFYGGFNYQEIYYSYPDVVEHPYDVVYYSIASARDYLALFGSEAKIRPWLQDFDLAIDSSRGVFYDAEKIGFEIEASQNATSSGWLLWNPSYIYTKEALK
ncbi:MAG: hypothetical protein HYV47_03470 [Candidatus Nealsonbacteria bacterium]|nr:hypothetical protein [Candidatus Nealsonbacteria bacterium]